MPRTILAFDYGTRNIGLAVGQEFSCSAQELSPLKARDGIPDWNQVARVINEWQPALLLVGLPLNMDGSDSEFGQRARKFGNRLHGRFGLAVEMVDERLTTFSAKGEAMARGHGGNYREAPVDSIAARLILESWFQQKS